MKRYLTFDIGCIECGEESAVVGLFDTEEQADQAVAGYLQPGSHWGRSEWHGQHNVEVFEVERKKREDERKKRVAAWAEERAANPPPPGPRYHILLKGPEDVGKGLGNHGETVASDLDGEQVIAERDRLESIFGATRIKVQERR